MKIRAQIGMVLNLDKCIGCHTCSVTCKNVWTSRARAWNTPGSTTSRPSPASAIRRNGRTRTSGTAAGCARPTARSSRARAASGSILMNIFANPNLPEIDDYYEPFTFDYEHLQTAPEMKAAPTARPRSPDHRQADGEDRMGPELGGDPRRRVRQALAGHELRRRSRRRSTAQFENTFMMYLPRLCEHCLNPTCVASCPSGSIYKREEDGIVLIDQDKCRGWRMCVSRLPVQEDLLQLAVRQGREVHLLLSAHRGRPADGVLGDLRRPHPLPRRAAVRRRPHRGGGERRGRARPVRTRSSACSSIRTIRAIIEQARARRRARRVDRGGAKRSPVYKMAVRVEGGASRCTPSTARCRWSGTSRRCRRSRRRAEAGAIGDERRNARRRAACASRSSIWPTCSPRATRRRSSRALERMLAMRAYMRGKPRRRRRSTRGAASRSGYRPREVEDMYRLMAIANYEDRFVIPTTHREYAEDAFDLQGLVRLLVRQSAATTRSAPGACSAASAA